MGRFRDAQYAAWQLELARRFQPSPRASHDDAQVQAGPHGYYRSDSPVATITRAQIRQFHRDVADGKYVGRDAEKLAFDIAMVEAAKAGRITGA
jgi:hypothetical protein